MPEALDRLAAKLESRLGQPDAHLHLSAEDRTAILELTAVVAHGSERTNAPLAAFLVGRYTALRGTGQPIDALLADALADAREVFG
ncbi:MAG: DUF6457 domain-containing protein [Chloroflexi bacterium]|nr:DUF6457 domain-containing protein [Chloroflexota bacterium]